MRSTLVRCGKPSGIATAMCSIHKGWVSRAGSLALEATFPSP